MPELPRSVNHLAVAIFAPVLILTGIAGFLVPAAYGLTSGAAPYNIFHIFFGGFGLLLVWMRKEIWLVVFNLGFGMIDLYQAVASFLHLFPEKYFLWTRVDDILHILIGMALIIIGGYGFLRRPMS